MLRAVIDISHHNGTALSFGEAEAAGIQAVIQKATQGVSGVDPTFASNRSGIDAANLLFGAYHFGDGSDGGAQARHFLSTVGPGEMDLLALDFENNPAGPSITLEEARAFVSTVFGAIGKWPVLYSGHFLKQLLNGKADPVLSNCPLWLAQYGPVAVLPPGWDKWSLWQYTDGAVPEPTSVAGIGHCDRNVFDGGHTELREFWSSVSQ